MGKLAKFLDTASQIGIVLAIVLWLVLVVMLIVEAVK